MWYNVIGIQNFLTRTNCPQKGASVKKLLVVFLVVLVTAFVSAEAESLKIEEMQERISDVVGYKPYYIAETCDDDVYQWTFIMHGGIIGTWSSNEEDIGPFLELVSEYQYDWYQQLPEMVEISTEKGLDIKGEGIHFEVDPIWSSDDSLVLEWMVWSEEVEDFIRTEDGYIFSKKYLANLVYTDEMASVRYMAELLEEAME